jgi:hypothetical protein
VGSALIELQSAATALVGSALIELQSAATALDGAVGNLRPAPIRREGAHPG